MKSAPCNTCEQMKELHKFLPLIKTTLTGPRHHQCHKNQCHYYSGRLISYSASLLFPLHPPCFQRSALLQKPQQPGLLSANHQANWVRREIRHFTFQPRKAGHTSNKYRHTRREGAGTPTRTRMPALHTCSDRHMHTSTCPFENTSKHLAKCNVMLNASFNLTVKCMWYCYHLSESKKKKKPLCRDHKRDSSQREKMAKTQLHERWHLRFRSPRNSRVCSTLI